MSSKPHARNAAPRGAAACAPRREGDLLEERVVEQAHDLRLGVEALRAEGELARLQAREDIAAANVEERGREPPHVCEQAAEREQRVVGIERLREHMRREDDVIASLRQRRRLHARVRADERDAARKRRRQTEPVEARHGRDARGGQTCQEARQERVCLDGEHAQRLRAMRHEIEVVDLLPHRSGRLCPIHHDSLLPVLPERSQQQYTASPGRQSPALAAMRGAAPRSLRAHAPPASCRSAAAKWRR